MRVRRAFTLVELLIAIVITGFVMSAVITLFFSVFKNYELHQDISSAKQRGHIALALIQPFVLNAGLGLPPDNASDPQAFQRAFVDIPPLEPLFPAQQNQRFSSFVQLAEIQSSGEMTVSAASEASALWLVYSISSGTGVDKGFEPRRGVVLDIPIRGTLDLQHVAAYTPDTPNPLKSWVVFPSATTPLLVQNIGSGGTVRIMRFLSNLDDKVLPLDEMRFVRAVKIFVSGTSLIVNRLDGSSGQTVADGIAGMWCRFDQNERVLTVYILARADTRREPGVQGALDGWPAAADVRWPRDAAYRYAVVSRSWRIRN
jgi:prepilin-type N-terminal cleavage/methylation domain-containing protein